ncbi:MAG: hypothetical protein QM270_03745, partial [Bacillota bacterium]|nr:hypothetical protein [Bacillota bacterium]
QPWRFASCAAPFGHYREQQEAHPDGKRGCMPGRRLAGGKKQPADFWWSKRRVIQKKIWITRHLDHKRAVSGQNEEKSKMEPKNYRVPDV